LSYQVIARKWRPQVFADLVGQDHVSQTLLNALRHDRLHHALLFTGPRGTGKTSSARILAKAIRCPNAKEYVPCGVCQECLDISAGRALDVIEIDGASNNGVESIRELIDTVGYMPASGSRKVYIIDEVHMLSTSAFNALLKTLEEPPPHVLFMMATTEVQKIPATILSRCQRFDFRRISTKAIASQLKTICTQDGLPFEPDALWLIARQGDGSMRDALSILDQLVTFSEGTLTLEKTVAVLGLTDRRLLFDAFTALANRDVKATLAVCEKVYAAGFEAKLFVQELLETLRNALFLRLESTLVDLPESDATALKELAKPLSNEDLHLLFDMALKGIQDVTRATDTRIVLEMLLLRMSEAPRVQALTKWLQQTPEASSSEKLAAPVPQKVSPVANANKPSTTATPTAPARSEAPPESPREIPPKAGSLAERWQDLVHKIKAVNGVVGAQLENSFLKSLEGQTAVIGIPPKLKFLLDQVQDPAFQRKALNYVTTFWGPGFHLKFETADEPGTTPKVLTEQRQQSERDQIRTQIENHPFVKSTQSLFKSEIKVIKESKQ
jgi:DNA polymerase-3 subunit gamma/tau